MTKHLFQKITFSLLVLTGCLIGLNQYRTARIHPPTKSELLAQELMGDELLSTSTIETAYKELFQEREKAMKQDVSEQLEIPLAEWEARKAVIVELFNNYGHKEYTAARQEGTALPPAIVEKVQKILQEVGVNPKKIYLLSDKLGLSNASAGVNYIKIDEDNFTKLAPESQRFVIAHEVTHTIFKDAPEETALQELIVKKYGAVSDEHKQILYAVSQFHEERADVFAFLHDEPIRNGAITRFADGAKLETPDYRGATHPPYRQRIAYAQSIDNLYKKCSHA